MRKDGKEREQAGKLARFTPTRGLRRGKEQTSSVFNKTSSNVRLTL